VGRASTTNSLNRANLDRRARSRACRSRSRAITLTGKPTRPEPFSHGDRSAHHLSPGGPSSHTSRISTTAKYSAFTRLSCSTRVRHHFFRGPSLCANVPGEHETQCWGRDKWRVTRVNQIGQLSQPNRPGMSPRTMITSCGIDSQPNGIDTAKSTTPAPTPAPISLP